MLKELNSHLTSLFADSSPSLKKTNQLNCPNVNDSLNYFMKHNSSKSNFLNSDEVSIAAIVNCSIFTHDKIILCALSYKQDWL